MKRLIATGLALSLLGSTAAMAHDYGRNYGHNWGHSAPYRGSYGYDHGYRYRDNGNTAAVVGLGVLALGAFAALAANNNSRYDYNYSYAPSYRYGYGPSYGYSGGYYGGGYGYRR